MEDEWTHDTMFQLISPMHVFQVISNKKKNPAYEILSVAEMSHILSYLLEEKKPQISFPIFKKKMPHLHNPAQW